MTGSAGLAAWVAQIVFWALLLIGVASGELGRRGGALFAALWCGGYLAIWFAPAAAALLTPYLALLDLVLVFVIFKGDVRLN
jgi:hypothetical protein